VRQKSEKKPPIEADPRFPSGEWKGFWLQRGFPGRQWMALSLEFRAGNVTGEGRDLVGDFLLNGTYALDTGKCSLIKTYVGRYSVVYDGANENDGKWIWGVWKLPLDTGGFHIWPKGEADPTLHRKSAQQALPAAAPTEKKLVPIGAAEDAEGSDAPR
jgi:hypothetical protein